jgi:hypothetical protein
MAARAAHVDVEHGRYPNIEWHRRYALVYERRPGVVDDDVNGAGVEGLSAASTGLVPKSAAEASVLTAMTCTPSTRI